MVYYVGRQLRELFVEDTDMATLFRVILYVLVFLAGWCIGRCEQVDPVTWLAGVFHYQG